MTRMGNTVKKNITNKKNMCVLTVLSLLIVILIVGIKFVYAYYQVGSSSIFLATRIGDFDLGDGDINMMIYRENNEGDFVRVHSVPAAYYVFNDELTSCTVPCNDSAGNCEYNFNNSTRKFDLSSNQKVTCKFYFEKQSSSDVNVYIYTEDEFGTHSYNTKNYLLSNNIPAYGYEYSGNYVCVSECGDPTDAVVTYNSETKKFNVSTTTKTNCFVYFNETGNSDVRVNTYVQDEYGSSAYTLVNYIPKNKIYVLNESKSSCTSIVTDGSAGTISYNDGYIEVDANSAQTCNVYLDLESN